MQPHASRLKADTYADSGHILRGAPMHSSVIPVVAAFAIACGTRIPFGRLGSTDEIARVVLFLACEDSSFMTGEEVVVDGGMTRV